MNKRRRLFSLVMLLATSVSLVALPATSANADSAGFVQIVNQAARSCIDVRTEDGIHNNGARTQNYHCTDSATMRWRLDAVGDGFYRIVNKASGKCMDVAGALTERGILIQQWDCVPVPQQQFQALWQPGYPLGYYQLVARHSGLCVELSNGNGNDHTPIYQNTCTLWYAQLWQFRD